MKTIVSAELLEQNVSVTSVETWKTDPLAALQDDIAETATINLDRVQFHRKVVLSASSLEKLNKRENATQKDSFLAFNSLHHGAKLPAQGQIVLVVPELARWRKNVLGDDPNAHAIPDAIWQQVLAKAQGITTGGWATPFKDCTPDNTRFIPGNYQWILTN